MKRHLCNSSGGVLVIVAGALAAMIGLTALVVDGGFGLITRNELHNIGDAAALAGARKLGKIYEALSPSQQQTYILTSTDRAAIIAYMNNVSTQNQAGGIPIPIQDDPSIVQIGHWSGTVFTERNAHPDAVHVTGRRDVTSAGNGPLSTFLAPLFGVSQLSVSVSSTAALTGVKQIAAGKLDCPVGIPKGYAGAGTGCTNLVFSGQGACAGWHTYFDTPPSVAKLRSILDGIRLGTYSIPAAKVGDKFNYNGGQLQAAFSNFQNLYNAKKDPATGEWSTTIVVYDIDSCSTNPTGPISIVGFVSATITGIFSGNIINARVDCNIIDPGPGGGGTVGNLGSIPSLVQ
jgi:hypothetical protein